MSTIALQGLAERLRYSAAFASQSDIRAINLQIAGDLEAIIVRDGEPPYSAEMVGEVREKLGGLSRGSAVVLVMLLIHPGRTLTYEDLSRGPRNCHYSRRSLNVFTHHLRRKLAESGFDDVIHGVRGVGYRMTAPDAIRLIEHYGLDLSD